MSLGDQFIRSFFSLLHSISSRINCSLASIFNLINKSLPKTSLSLPSPIWERGFTRSEFGEEAGTHMKQGGRCGKKLAFVLIDFEKWCFSLLCLFHLSKMHVFVMCNRIPLNITIKVTTGCKV